MVGKTIDRHQDCKLCDMRKGARRPVWGIGSLDADIMIVGEGPGGEEDRRGEPFIGPAGKLLRDKLADLGVRAEDVYITNATKCRPPAGTKPKTDEIKACLPHLLYEIEVVNPKTIITLGAIATRAVLGKSFKMGEVNGQEFDWRTYLVVPVYHPASQLHYNAAKGAKREGMTKQEWEKKHKVRLAESDSERLKEHGIEAQAEVRVEHVKQPIDFFNEGMDKVFKGGVTAARQQGLGDFF